MTADAAFQTIHEQLGGEDGVSAGQLFGKMCLKVNGKAFMALHLETLAFKLTGPEHARALALTGARLWDPSGKNRPMKEWVAVPASAHTVFLELAQSALVYVSSGS